MDKNLLRAFGKASAMNAFPSYKSVELLVTPNHWWNTYTAPEDGFFSVEGSASAGAIGDGAAEVLATVGSSSLTSGGSARATIPVRKGETVSFAAKGTFSVNAKFYYAKATQ